jgi:aminoglycoside phosphotransferase (APT) family kinase protein
MLASRIEAGALLSMRERDALLAALHALPEGDRICHGDFHPGNVMLGPDGDVILDWVDATRGQAAADVARTSVLMRGHFATSGAGAEALAAMRQFHRLWLDRYVALTGLDAAACKAWIPIVAAARLSEGIAEQQQWLLALARGAS